MKTKALHTDRHVLHTLLALTVLAGCTGANEKTPFVYEDAAGQTHTTQRKTLYGLCGAGSTDSTLIIVSDIGDTLTLDTRTARTNGTLLGGYETGDRIVAELGTDTTVVKSAINESTLLGDWVMLDPYDGSSTVGISIKDGGVAESIDQPGIIYKAWRIAEGKLEITYIREGGSEEEEKSAYTIAKLNRDSLIYEDEEEIYEYARRK